MENFVSKIKQLIDSKRYTEASNELRKFINSGQELPQHSIDFANKLIFGADWELVSALLPFETDFFETSGWLRSIKESKPVDKDGNALPWLNYAAIDYIGSKINNGMAVFEWGCGYSTLWMAGRVKKISSVEDNHSWYSIIKNKLPDNANVHYAKDKESYVNSILKTDEIYDVIQIDGSYREECTEICVKKLKEDGFIIFDNTDEEKFDQAVVNLETLGFNRIDFTGLIPSYAYKNCTSIFFKDMRFLKNEDLPSKINFSSGITCIQAVNKNK